MRGFAVVGLLLAAGCDSLLGDDDSVTRLLLYATPRQPPTDGRHIAIIGAEAVREDGRVPAGALCVRVSVQLGTLGSSTGDTPPVVTDAGVSGCPSARCTFVVLPTSSPRREFIIYEAPAIAAQDIVSGALYDGGTDAAVCEGTPLTTQVLTLDIPDVPLPAPDMHVPVGDGGAP